MKMLYKIVAMVAIASIPLVSFEQSQKKVCFGDVTLLSQADVNSFPAVYGCTEMSGQLYISGNDIIDLDSLYQIIKIGGDLTIYKNDLLTAIDGLKIGFVGGVVDISDNKLLTNLDGLQHLVSIGYWTSARQGLIISDNPSLASIKGLNALTFVPGILDIENNITLTNLDGFESLTQIGLYNTKMVSLIIAGNTNLISINGLSALRTIAGYHITGVTISNNQALDNLDGLSSLTEVSGGYAAGISILNNTSLTNVNGLSALASINAAYTNLNIKDNPQLKEGAALYTLLHNNEYECQTNGDCIVSAISGNGDGFTKSNILSKGAYLANYDKPTGLLFSSVTKTSISLSFIVASQELLSGYITLMSDLPFSRDVPIEGISYNVGDVIGSSTVVGIGKDTSLTVNDLKPDTNYYFGVFSYSNSTKGIHYLIPQQLAGVQKTDDEIVQMPDVTLRTNH